MNSAVKIWGPTNVCFLTGINNYGSCCRSWAAVTAITNLPIIPHAQAPKRLTPPAGAHISAPETGSPPLRIALPAAVLYRPQAEDRHVFATAQRNRKITKNPASPHTTQMKEKGTTRMPLEGDILTQS